LVKASWVILALPEAIKSLSARNKLMGSIIKITQGSVNAEVLMQLDGGNLVSTVITIDSVADLKLVVGMKACAVFKASSVIMGVTD
jgi:molybdate transport system regulatory protein